MRRNRRSSRSRMRKRSRMTRRMRSEIRRQQKWIFRRSTGGAVPGGGRIVRGLLGLQEWEQEQIRQ